MKHTFLIVILTVSALCFAQTVENKAEPIGRLQCGIVINAELSETKLPLLRESDIIKHLSNPENGSGLIPGEEAPKRDHAFAVITVSLAPGCAVSRYDYKLIAWDSEYTCLGTARENAPYDPRILAIEYSADTSNEVNLLFEIPENTSKAEIIPGLNFIVPSPPVILNFSD